MAIQNKFTQLVGLLSQDPNETDLSQIISLLTGSNVNRVFDEQPLIHYYLRYCNIPNQKVLTAFANYGCNFNVSFGGQTPLHLLLTKNASQDSGPLSDDSQVMKPLIEAGADVRLRNALGLIPLQAALSSKSALIRSVFDLAPLVPGKDDLELLVPRPDVRTMDEEPMNLSVQVWFVALLTKYGLVLFDGILAIARANVYCNIGLFERLLFEFNVIPKVEDLMAQVLDEKEDEISLFLDHMIINDIRELNLTIPDITSQVISLIKTNEPSTHGMLDQLVVSNEGAIRKTVKTLPTNEIEFTLEDLKNALLKNSLAIAYEILMKVNNLLADRIRLEMPNILMQVEELYQANLGKNVTRNQMDSLIDQINTILA